MFLDLLETINCLRDTTSDNSSYSANAEGLRKRSNSIQNDNSAKDNPVEYTTEQVNAVNR